MNSVFLIDRHFPRFETSAFELHSKVANHQNFVERLLLGEVRSVDGFEAREEFLGLLQILVDGLLRTVVELVVPTLVSDGGSEDRAGAQPILPLLGEKIIERLAPRFERGWRSGDE